MPAPTSRLPWVYPIRLLRIASVAAIVVILVASLSPQAPAVETGYGDKLDHLAAYAILVMLCGGGWFRRGWSVPLTAAVVGLGGVFELLQSFSPGRQPDWADFTVNSLGALTGLLAAMMIERMLRPYLRTIRRPA
jgi:VanZ family protein